MTRKVAITIIAIFGTFFCSSLRAQDSKIQHIEELSDSILNTTDIHDFHYALPSWISAVETDLPQADAAALKNWAPQNMTRIDTAPEATAWATTWYHDNFAILLWICARPESDGSQTIMAFADDIESNDSIFSISPIENEGLTGFEVLQNSDGERAFCVHDIMTRMDLRTVTDIRYSYSQKDEAENRIINRLNEATETLSGSLAGFPEMTVCDAPDKRVRAITYMTVYKDFTYHSSGWIVTRGKKDKISITQLHDATSQIGQPEQAILTPNKWYGALYTDIIQFRSEKQDYYVLLGFKGANASIKTRVIDVLHNNNGTLTFGANVFIHPKLTYRRRIYQYSARASMQMKYDEKSKMIVFDHLEPSDRLYVGQYSFYGPDLSYDAYLLSDDGWKFQSDIQMTEEDGAQPNPEIGETQSDLLTEPGAGQNRRVNPTSNSGWSGRSSRSYNSTRRSSSKSSNKSYNSTKRRSSNKSSSHSSWFDKGKGNSAPNIR